jgi:hypothetical protein
MTTKKEKPRSKVKARSAKAVKKTVTKVKKKAVKTRKKADVASVVTRRPGRPSSYTEQVGLSVCGWIKQGYTLRQIAALPNMPNKSTIIRWLAEHTEFCDHYARAGEIRALVMADEIIEIADDSTNDWVEREGKNGTVELVPNEELMRRSRTRIDTRKWLMSKMAPKRFGERLALTGKDGGPLEHVHKTVGDLLDDIDGAGTGLPSHAIDRRG